VGRGHGPGVPEAGALSASIEMCRAMIAGTEAAGSEALPERPAASPMRTMLVPALRCDRCGDVFCGLGEGLCGPCDLDKAQTAEIRRALQAGHWGAHVRRQRDSDA
jgi:hypothetical protein